MERNVFLPKSVYLQGGHVWCRNCQQEVPGDFSGTHMRLRCAYCDTLEPVPAIKTSRRELVTHAASMNQCQSGAANITSAPALPVMAQATIEPTQLSLPNGVHLVPNRNHERNPSHLKRIDELRAEAPVESERERSTTSSTAPHVAGFFMTFFFFGQVMSNWALYAGHYSAWICGLAFSVVGITIAVGSLLIGMKTRNRMIHRLQSVRRDGSHQPAIPQASMGLVDASPQKASA